MKIPVALRAGLAAVVVAACFAVVIPTATGVSWSTTAGTLATVPGWAVAGLALVWAAGLLVHATVLTAALPGLTVRRAVTMSLTGSAIANLLPVGGAAGIALNYSMARSWGFSRPAFTSYTLVTNIWAVLAKMSLPVVGLVALSISPVPGVGSLRPLALVACAALVVLVGGGALALARCTRLRPTRGVASAARVVIRSGWTRLSLGTVGYTALLSMLLWLCLDVTGTALGWSALLVALSVERVSTLVHLTPGGLGVVEAGLVGVLVAMGGHPSAVVAGVLLYRFFTFAIEIPVGGLWLAVWWAVHDRRTPVMVGA